ncbi:MAG: hypothetical protein ACK4VV_11720 [Pseudomonas sp.]
MRSTVLLCLTLLSLAGCASQPEATTTDQAGVQHSNNAHPHVKPLTPYIKAMCNSLLVLARYTVELRYSGMTIEEMMADMEPALTDDIRAAVHGMVRGTYRMTLYEDKATQERQAIQYGVAVNKMCIETLNARAIRDGLVDAAE